MDASGFTTLALQFAGRTVVTCDLCGLGHSTRKDGQTDHAPVDNAADVHWIIQALGGGPVEMFVSSGGAVTHAFESLDVNRVQFKVDARNMRSLRSMAKLGAINEGTLRRYQIRPDGFARDSVMWSVLSDEWPAIKARLQARLQLQ
jgi:hypothetical protein